MATTKQRNRASDLEAIHQGLDEVGSAIANWLRYEKAELAEYQRRKQLMAKHGCCVDGVCTTETCMELPGGKTCGDCHHVGRCKAMFGHTETDTYCDWFPRRFRECKSSRVRTPELLSLNQPELERDETSVGTLNAFRDLVSRYQACSLALWQLFRVDPLGDSPAHYWIERLEQLVERGLLLPNQTNKRDDYGSPYVCASCGTTDCWITIGTHINLCKKCIEEFSTGLASVSDELFDNGSDIGAELDRLELACQKKLANPAGKARNRITALIEEREKLAVRAYLKRESERGEWIPDDPTLILRELRELRREAHDAKLALNEAQAHGTKSDRKIAKAELYSAVGRLVGAIDSSEPKDSGK